MFSVGLFFSFGGSGAWSWALGGGGRPQQGGKPFPQIRKPRTPHPQTTRHILLSLRLPQLCGAWAPPQD